MGILAYIKRNWYRPVELLHGSTNFYKGTIMHHVYNHKLE